MTALLERARRDLEAAETAARAANASLLRAAHERRHTMPGTSERATVEGGAKLAAYQLVIAWRAKEAAEATILLELGREDRAWRSSYAPPAGCSCEDWARGALDLDCPVHLWKAGA